VEPALEPAGGGSPLDHVLDQMYDRDGLTGLRARSAGGAVPAREVAPARADDEFDRIDRDFGRLLDEQRWVEAIPLARRLADLTRGEAGADSPEHAIWLRNLGALNIKVGDLRQAEGLLTRALEICRRADGPDRFATGICLIDMADLRAAQGRLRSARNLVVQAIEILDAAVGPEHPLTTRARATRARIDRMDDPTSIFGSVSIDT
jgi:tetratricopeptide (TPR) repeat protein